MPCRGSGGEDRSRHRVARHGHRPRRLARLPGSGDPHRSLAIGGKIARTATERAVLVWRSSRDRPSGLEGRFAATSGLAIPLSNSADKRAMTVPTRYPSLSPRSRRSDQGVPAPHPERPSRTRVACAASRRAPWTSLAPLAGATPSRDAASASGKPRAQRPSFGRFACMGAHASRPASSTIPDPFAAEPAGVGRDTVPSAADCTVPPLAALLGRAWQLARANRALGRKPRAPVGGRPLVMHRAGAQQEERHAPSIVATAGVRTDSPFLTHAAARAAWIVASRHAVDVSDC